jgi:hypothetical protein
LAISSNVREILEQFDSLVVFGSVTEAVEILAGLVESECKGFNCSIC